MSQLTPDELRQVDALVDTLLHHFGEVFQTRRKALGITLQEVHQTLGLDASNLSHFENGKKRATGGKKPASLTLRNFLKLKLYYDVGWQQLLAPLPPSTTERLIARILQTPKQVQESFLYLLEEGLGERPPAAPPCAPLACLATTSPSA